MHERSINMTHLVVTVVVLLSFVICSCNKTEKKSSSDPVLTVQHLLDLYNLKGKKPDDRTERQKKKDIDKADLDKLILDIDVEDKFITDIYIGFVLGSLAQNQERLFVTRQGKTAKIAAGRTKIILNLKNNVWKINLAASIPPEFKQRALAEKIRYKNAKAHAPRI